MTDSDTASCYYNAAIPLQIHKFNKINRTKSQVVHMLTCQTRHFLNLRRPDMLYIRVDDMRLFESYVDKRTEMVHARGKQES
jgi:hypothetical protein